VGFSVRVTHAVVIGGNDVFEIRDLKLGDIDALVSLFDAVLPGFAPSLTPDLAGPMSFVNDPSSFALGAYVDDDPAGLAWGLQMRSPNGRLTTYVHELDVSEQWRRQGVATALVTEAMTIARRGGSTRFWLSTGGHNQVAQALYESLGGVRKPLGDVNYWWQLDEPTAPA
jgi:ribosomal protein S18 acetylase RimI-like enzyme